MKILCIQASARTDGNTAKIVSHLQQLLPMDIIHLKDLNIGHFDYDFNNRDDDFFPLIQNFIEKYDVLLLATPIYWYTMSSYLKAFMDRISDLLIIDKATGRKLRGKCMASLACGSAQEPTEAFFAPIRSSAEYLGMEYIGEVHTWIEQTAIPSEVKPILLAFAKEISSVKKK